MFDFFQANEARPAIGLIASVLGGAVVTYAFSEVLHFFLHKTYPGVIDEADRLKWLAVTIGFLERALFTSVFIWAPQAIGALAGSILAVKAVGGWGSLQTNRTEARARYYVAFMGSLGSMFWAVACGIWVNLGHT